MAYLPLKFDVIDDTEQLSEARLNVHGSLAGARRDNGDLPNELHSYVYLIYIYP